MDATSPDRYNIKDENWETLKTLFPENWIEIGRSCGAFQRLRGFSSPEILLRVLLIHLGGHSLRTTAVIAQEAGLANISDVAIFKRLKSCKKWFHKLALSLLDENSMDTSPGFEGYNTRLIDATTVKEPGKTGGEWNIHYSMQLPNLICDYFQITPRKGVGTGESLSRFSVKPKDLLVADRGYCAKKGVKHACESGGQIIIRFIPKNLVLMSTVGGDFDLMTNLETLQHPGDTGDWSVFLKDYTDFEYRICAIRKTLEAEEKALIKLKQLAIRKQTKTRLETFEYAKYVIIITSLKQAEFSAEAILDLYRRRWQIELTFKRFKSMTGFGHLPKDDNESAKAWLYGKLFVALLSEKLAWLASNFSPWGLTTAGRKREEYLERV